MRRLALVSLVAVCAALVRPAAAETLTDVRVIMDDGVPLAADIYIPDGPDRDGDGLYPCVVELTPYRKENRASEGASFLPGQGIALIEVDARGTGGSGGEYDIVFSVREQADAAAMVEWAATAATKPDGSPLCESTVGMYGGSYSGIIQELVATLPQTAQGDVPAAPPHLAAIAPQRAYGDLYRDIVYHGGMVIGSFGTIWSAGTTAYYTEPPLDVDTADGQAAWIDHLTKNDPLIAEYLKRPYDDASYVSDDSSPAYMQRIYTDSSALSRIENLTVPALQLAGFYDTFTRGQLLLFSKAHALEVTHGDRGPNFLIAGPWNHSGTHFITPDEGFRQNLADWYHYFLEDRANGDPAPDWIANGFDGNGARAMYFQSTSGTVNAQTPADGVWRTSATWPPTDIAMQRLYLSAGGTLTATPDPTTSASAYVSNPTAGTGEVLSRWDNAASGSIPHPQWDQRVETGKGLTYQTETLSAPLRIAGPIAMRLFATVRGIDTGVSTEGTTLAEQVVPGHPDTDFVVKLSDVAPDGSVRLVTQGYLRASHRAVDPDRSVFLGGENVSPYHLHTRASLDPPADGEARAYDIEIWPTSKTFDTGHRIRIDVYSADTPAHITILEPTLNQVWSGASMASYIALPVGG